MPKITKFDLTVLGITAAFLLTVGLWCGAQRSVDSPFTVRVSRNETTSVVETVTAPAEESAPGKLLPGEKIDLNHAPAADLQRLPGIGEKRALAIVAWREEHGPFAQIEDLTQVSGIGEKILEQCRDYITVEG